MTELDVLDKSDTVSFKMGDQPVNVAIPDINKVLRHLSQDKSLLTQSLFRSLPEEEKLLKSIGLSYTPSPGEMAINVNDRKNFTSFLQSLDINQANDSELKVNLEKISNQLYRDMANQYNLIRSPLKEVDEEENLEPLIGLKEIVNEYKRLDLLNESTSKIDDCLTHASQGDLREYVAVLERNLLGLSKDIPGPHEWHNDSYTLMFEARWTEAVVILEKIDKNPKASNLFTQLRPYLIECLNFSEGQIEKNENISPESKVELRSAIFKTRSKIG